MRVVSFSAACNYRMLRFATPVPDLRQMRAKPSLRPRQSFIRPRHIIIIVDVLCRRHCSPNQFVKLPLPIHHAKPSGGIWSNACGRYRRPSGAVIEMSWQPSSASSAAFFRAASAVSRRRTIRPETSVPVTKKRMRCQRQATDRPDFRPVTQAGDEAKRN